MVYGTGGAIVRGNMVNEPQTVVPVIAMRYPIRDWNKRNGAPPSSVESSTTRMETMMKYTAA
jgi:hypothetical protein